MEISYFIECYDNGKRSTTESVSKKCEEVAKEEVADPTVPTREKATTTSSTVSQTTTADLTSTAASSTIRLINYTDG